MLREAALPNFEADRRAKKELKKRVRGVRPIECAVEGRDDPEAEVVVRGYAAARSMLTDDGQAPLDAAGLQQNDRLGRVADSLQRVGAKGGAASARNSSAFDRQALAGTTALWPSVRQGFVFVHAAARLLGNAAGEPGALVTAALRRALGGDAAAL